jgi:cobalt/nickel transport system ATP-binding protein
LLLETRALSFSHPEGEVLRAVDLRLAPGERVALVGPNGAGKTTLLHLLVGLERPDCGEVVAFGRTRRVEADFHDVRARVGLVFQDPDDQLFCPTVLEDVAFGPLNLGASQRQARAKAEATLKTLGLDGFGSRITSRLSGGEKRLVALATVLAMEPEVLLLDEPTNGLDAASEERLMAHLELLPQAMLIVSHDHRLLLRLTHRALALIDGHLTDAVLHRHAHWREDWHLHAEGLTQDHTHRGDDDASGRL